MTVLVQGPKSYYFATQAVLLDDTRDVASSWASKHIVANEAIKWIVAKYVEADNANYNGQMWKLQDLQLKKPTIVHSPMNINHAAHHIVGTFPAAEMMYPTGVGDQAQQQLNPYVEVLGAIWQFYFPEEMAAVEAAFKEGSLYTSMECVSHSVTCAASDGCGKTFDYKGPISESYCEHLQKPGGVRQLNDPHFLAGALIIPPARPGWGGASVDEISALIEANLAQAERLYDEISRQSPHLDSKAWENLMIDLLHRASLEDDEEKTPAEILGRRVARQLLR
jgi:hypothetical protein